MEFHILSCRGVETGRRTKAAAENLCGYLREQGLKFRKVFITPGPVGLRGKSTILSQANYSCQERYHRTLMLPAWGTACKVDDKD